MSLNSIYIWRCQTKATIEDTASLTNKKGRRGGTIALTATRIESPIIKLLDRTLKKLECRPCGLSFYQLKDASPFPVKHSDFPKTPEGYPAEHPCADGGTIWIPLIGNPDVMISQFLHELAHCLLHYPNGRDPDMEDPVLAQVRETGNHDLLFESPMEAEACAAAYLAARMLSLPDSHNETYLSIWRGDMDKFRRESLSRCISAAKAIAANYQVPINGQSITERTTPITEPMTYKFNPHGDHVLVNMDGKWLMIDTGADTTVGNTATLSSAAEHSPVYPITSVSQPKVSLRASATKLIILWGCKFCSTFPSSSIGIERKSLSIHRVMSSRKAPSSLSAGASWVSCSTSHSDLIVSLWRQSSIPGRLSATCPI